MATMTVDAAIARLRGTDGEEFGCEASSDGLGDIAEILAAEVDRLRGADLTDRIRALTDDQRVELAGLFCTHCGVLDPRCQCWNDE